MADHGFNAVKFFVQWRWVHRDVDRWYFDDIDELMDLAGRVGLSVTINLIFDTSPAWLFREYPDAHMITARGEVLTSRAVACRSVGGYPGPCLNHPQAWVERERFIRQVVGRYGKHQAMGMWDVWNEPESCLFLRKPNDATLVCYCRHCHEGFVTWLRRKYGDIDRLNRVWGRCYDDFCDVELPRDRQTLTDMVDWRLFCLDSLAWEGRRRLDSVRTIDPDHPVYLHPVPNTWHFNAVMGVDTFQMADGCDCFAGSVLEWPLNPLHIVSAGNGRVCYSAETHKGYIVNDDADIVLKGKARDWGVMNKDGTNNGVYSPRRFLHRCPGSLGWQNHLARTCTALVCKTGANGIRLDSLGSYFFPCYNSKHRHASPWDYNRWVC